MKITFIAEHGVDVACAVPDNVKIEYEDEGEFFGVVKHIHDEFWNDGSDSGYEEIIAENKTKIENFKNDDKMFLTYVVVPYGYLVITR